MLIETSSRIAITKMASFSDDLSNINLTGSKVKSCRNRIVPVPSYINVLLPNGLPNNNIFSGSSKPYKKGYLSLIWRRFNRHYPTMNPSVTIYLFRHSGAIDIFKRTGSITKLKKAMGNSSKNDSLTYLRGLEIPKLNEEDIQMI